MAQMRQPDRHLQADLAKDTFEDFLDDFFLVKYFQVYCEIDGHEFQLRREAIKLCRERGFSIQAALWNSHHKQEHRTRPSVQPLSIANSRSSGSGGGISSANKREMEKLEREAAELRETARSRSRGSRRSTAREMGKKKGKNYQLRTRYSAGHQKPQRRMERCLVTKMDELIVHKCFGSFHKRNVQHPGFCFKFKAGRCKDRSASAFTLPWVATGRTSLLSIAWAWNNATELASRSRLNPHSRHPEK